MHPDQWRSAHAEIFFLDPNDLGAIGEFMRNAGILTGGETVLRAGTAGDGNMNCTIRVTTERRNFIVKQSRPWVEKYPQFEAPWDRAVREIEFYTIVSSMQNVAGSMPNLIHADKRSRVIVLEDVGVGRDYTGIYRGDQFADSEICLLAQYLTELHTQSTQIQNRKGLANREMRELNSQHIFFIPLLRDNGLNLNELLPGLAEVAGELGVNEPYVSEVHALAKTYLADGDHLLHGDFFPGSFLKTDRGPRMIDPEFAYFGRSEFDPAVFVAHLLLGRQTPQSIELFLEQYESPEAHDEELMLQFAGVEIMRRLIGYAQLPLGYGLAQRRELLECSKRLVLEPDRNLLLKRPV